MQRVLHSILSQKLPDRTACLSGAAKLARRQRGQKNCGPRERGRKLDHRAARFERGGSAVVVFAHFFLLFKYNSLENLGPPR